MRNRLLNHPGVAGVKLIEDGTAATLELDYDLSTVTLAEIERELWREQVRFGPEVACLVTPIQGMVSDRAEALIESALNELPGVVAKASYLSQGLRVEFDRRQCGLPRIIETLRRLGYHADFTQARPASDLGAELVEERPAVAARPAGTLLRWARWLRGQPEVALAILAGVLLLAGAMVYWSGGPDWLRIPLVVLAYVAAGRYTGIEAFHTLRQWRFNIDVLMFAAAFGAASLGHFEEGALLLFLFAVGNAGEHLAMTRARRAIEELSRLAPETAHVRDESGHESIVPVEQVSVGQIVIVRPFERMPVDGEVIEGASAVDQSNITGESAPVEKARGSSVFAGTMNADGRLVVRVTRHAGQSTLAKIVRLVEEAQTTKSPTEMFTAKVERFYVPAVLVATLALIVVPPLAGIEPLRAHRSHWAGWFYQAMAFLTAASPCALAIGTPSAILCGIARSARIGVLLKGGAFLEALGRIDAIAFDKTGTLTQGRPMLTDIVPLGETSAMELLALAAALEHESNHPLAQAIVAEAGVRNCPVRQAVDVEQIPGLGIVGNVDGRRIALGQIDLLRGEESQKRLIQEHIAQLADQGKSTVLVAINSQYVGILALSDRPRENARQTLGELKELGIKRTIMLTGDHKRAAAAIAAQVGVDEYFSDLLPEDKLSLIQGLRRRFRTVAMVGDGVNDAPALASASLGIAMGGAGSDVAIETADVVLMSSDLGMLPHAIGLSRRARRIILQNLLIALGVISITAPAAALGLTSLGMAVLLHEGSTVVVVLNSLRLLAYKARGMPLAAEAKVRESAPAAEQLETA